MGQRSQDDGLETGWDVRMTEAADELRMDAGNRGPVMAAVYPGDDPGFSVRTDSRQLADQYSVGPQERP
jgi:hypothetical protein